MFPMHRLLLLTATCLLGLAASASAGSLKVPTQFSTIQQAIDAAVPGDTIVLAPGVYDEVAMLDGLIDITLRGRKATLLSELAIVNCQDIMVKGLRFEGALGSILIENSTEVTVQRCRWQDAVTGVLAVSSSLVTIKRNRFFDLDGFAIAIGDSGSSQSTDCTVLFNLIKNVGSMGITVDGTLNTVGRNTVRDAEGIGGIGTVGGGSNVYFRNLVKGADGSGLVLLGSNDMALKNRIIDADRDGIAIEGDDNLVQRNKVRDVGTDGIDIEGSGNFVERNKVKRSGPPGGDCISLDAGTDNTLDRNRVTLAFEDGFRIATSGNTITNNRASKSGNFDLKDLTGGSGNSYSGNNFPKANIDL